MEDIYANVEYPKHVDSRGLKNHTGPSSPERRCYGAVILSLGLLSVFLLVGLISLGVRHHFSVRVSASLTERLQDSDNKLSSVSEERDLLNERVFNMTEELDRLQSLYKQNKTCPAGWRMFSSACYLLSTESGSWEEGKDNCRERGAHLSVIDSNEEQTFLSGVIEQGARYWIGLNDKDEEGTWKWTDGTPATLTNWSENQPDNGGGDPQWGEEDCAHMGPNNSKWNDVACKSYLRWICEKIA